MSAYVASGVLPVDKPEGPTSHDVVALARRALGTRRVGHTGTLDPFASGLLLLCVGWATRLAEYLVGLPKTYRATARLGESTTTDDLAGDVVAISGRWRELTAGEVEAAFRSQTGVLLQRPPDYSAKKVRGERLYDRARRGESVSPEPVPVRIHRIAVLALDLPDVEFEIECSSGTYIRAVARDVGGVLGTGAHLVALRRTRIGPHDVGIAVPSVSLADADAVREAWISPAAALRHLPAVDVDEAAARGLANGAPVACPEPPPAGDGPVTVRCSGRLLAVADLVDGVLRPRKVFPGD